VYSKRDRARLKLILRGKRFGYTLDEISDMIGLANNELGEKEQILKTLEYGERSLKEVRSAMRELQLIEQDILVMGERLNKRLEELKKAGRINKRNCGGSHNFFIAMEAWRRRLTNV
jgi:DNA-binding transcriptional MerR regulator